MVDGRLVIQERNSSGTPLVAYTRGTDLSGTFEGAGGWTSQVLQVRCPSRDVRFANRSGGMLARSSTYQSGNWTNHHAYHADGGGNITALVATNQVISGTYRFDPFGNLLSQSGSMAGANLYRFSSKMLVASALYHYGYRFYDPSYQRWINQDPIEEEGGLNLYGFVRNNPANSVDPFGLTDTDSVNACAKRNPGEVGKLARDHVGRANKAYDELVDLAKKAEESRKLGGSAARKKLRDAIEPGADDVAHHKVPHALREHPLVKRGAERGWDINGSPNGMAMPQNCHGPGFKSWHRKYNDLAEKMLDDAYPKNGHIHPDEAARRLQEIADKLTHEAIKHIERTMK